MKRTKEFRKSLFVTVMFLIMCCMMLLPSIDVNAAQVKLSTNTVTLNVGQSKTIKMKGTSKKVKWSTNKPKVATVSSKGKIKAVGQGTATVTAKVGKKSYKCKVLVYQTSSGDAEVDKKVRSIINKNITAKMSDAEKVKAIHDYIITHCDYDSEHKGMTENTCYTAYGALINQKAVCSGYTNAFQLCMDALDIPTQSIGGRLSDGESHAWNLVQINGDWYHIDLTFDDPVFPEETDFKNLNMFVSYEYFLVNDQKMKKAGRQWHLEWLGEGYEENIAEAYTNTPVCSSNSGMFVSVISPISKTTKQAAINLYTSYRNGEKVITLIVPQKTYKKNKNFINESLSLFFQKIGCSYPSGFYTYNYESYKFITIILE